MSVLNIAMLSVHSSPLGELGKKNNGGMSTYVIEIASALGKRGHHIDVFTLSHDPPSKPSIPIGEGVRLFHLDIGCNRELDKSELHEHTENIFAALERVHRRQKRPYDVVHSHYWLSGLTGEQAQAQWKVPHVMTFHSLGMVKRVVLHAESEPEIRIQSEKRLAQISDSVVVPTHREHENMINFYDAPTSRMTLIPCGVNLTRFRPYPKNEARLNLNLPADKALLLYVGRFTPEKGLENLVLALNRIDQWLESRLVIVGGDDPDDATTTRIRQQVQRLGLEHRVMFKGRVPNEVLPLYYSAADLMVLPSLYESFGLVALESLACGTPVVSTRVGALEHVIFEGKTGNVVPDAGPESLAKGIEKALIQNKQNGVTRAEVRASVLDFDWSHIAVILQGEYERLVDMHVLSSDRTLPRSASFGAY